MRCRGQRGQRAALTGRRSPRSHDVPILLDLRPAAMRTPVTAQLMEVLGAAAATFPSALGVRVVAYEWAASGQLSIWSSHRVAGRPRRHRDPWRRRHHPGSAQRAQRAAQRAQLRSSGLRLRQRRGPLRSGGGRDTGATVPGERRAAGRRRPLRARPTPSRPGSLALCRTSARAQPVVSSARALPGSRREQCREDGAGRR